MLAPAPIIDHAESSARGCYHCGLPLPPGKRFTVVIDGSERLMCCGGCEAVARTIADNNLTAYYQYRSALPASAPDTAPRVVDTTAFAIPEVEATAARPAGSHAREAELILAGITCAACVWLIE